MSKLADNLFEELRWRGLVHDMTEGADQILAEKKITGYIGFDPTADSLHVGSLLPIMVLVHMQRHGHTPIALAGGGTGMIGDPSGKTRERQLLTEEDLQHNLEGIKAQLAHFLDFDGVDNPALMLNNADWLRDLNLIAFMRDIGKHFTVNYMMAKESVRARLESQEGISYTEFTYMLLQAYDFLAQFDAYGCTFQLGGSDQWGNITAGVQLVRRKAGGEAHGLTVPLVTRSDGSKFGKSEGQNIWLAPERTRPYDFYQFWINTPDADVIQYLKFFTLLDQDEIAALEKSFAEAPHLREAQTRLAEEVTRAVHGEDALARAQRATDVLFGSGDISGLGAADLLEIFAAVPSSTMESAQLADEGKPVVDLVVETGLERSKKQTRNLIDNGGLYVNNEAVTDTAATLTASDAIDGEVLVLRKGKKSYHVIRVK